LPSRHEGPAGRSLSPPATGTMLKGNILSPISSNVASASSERRVMI
jgi:hypothetical protein